MTVVYDMSGACVIYLIKSTYGEGGKSVELPTLPVVKKAQFGYFSPCFILVYTCVLYTDKY